jgi:hypothetical protein
VVKRRLWYSTRSHCPHLPLRLRQLIPGGALVVKAVLLEEEHCLGAVVVLST